MKLFACGTGLAEGHRPIEKYFIVLAFQIASGGWGCLEGGGAGTNSNRSLPAELIGYSENNVPYPRSSEGRTLAEATFFCSVCSKRRPLGGTGRIRVLAQSPKDQEK